LSQESLTSPIERDKLLQNSDKTVNNGLSVQVEKVVKKEIEEPHLLDKENDIFKKIDDAFLQLSNLFKKLLSSQIFLNFYMLLSLIIFLIIFSLHFFSWQMNDKKWFIVFLWFLSSFYFLRCVISPKIMATSLIIFSFIVAIYCLKDESSPRTFGDKMKVLIGTILAIMILPLIVKACLSNDFVLLKYFLSN
jgi:membrane-associated HD superfamily phosphohydrolase